MQRDIKIDTLKGLGILLMILGHVNTPIRDFIFSFHMPLFFFISGYLFKDRDFNEIAKRNYHKILVPYLFTCIIIWILWIVLAQKWTWGLSILLANGSRPVYHFEDYYVGPLWFLMCYFVSIIGFHFLLYIKKKHIQFITICLLWIVAYIYTKKFNLLPFDLINAIPAVLCLWIGYNFKSEKVKRVTLSKPFLCFGALIWCMCIFKGSLSMASFYYRLWILQIIGAFYGTYFIYKLLIKVNWGGAWQGLEKQVY